MIEYIKSLSVITGAEKKKQKQMFQCFLHLNLWSVFSSCAKPCNAGSGKMQNFGTKLSHHVCKLPFSPCH